MVTENSKNSIVVFFCEKCDYTCSRKQDYNKHLLTAKHINSDIQLQKSLTPHICICGKEYKHRQGLCLHKKTCKNVNETALVDTSPTVDIASLTTLVIEVFKNNGELQKQNNEFKELLLEQNNKLIEVCKNNNSNTNITNNNNVNSHNKTFNMNVFLNEHCKDAMNISEFVDSIQLGFNDLVNVGKVGYVEGISSIIINKLRSLDIHKRPMHCGDEKRHSMYIKEDGKWEKQPEDNNRVRRLIKQVAFKNTKNTVLFKEKYPDCGTSASKYSDQYNKIVMESFGGRGASDEEKENKIVRMIAREVYVDKSF
jgi:hypothetical protein